MRIIKKEAELLTYNYKQIFNFDYKTMFHYCTTGKKSTKVIINKIPVSVEFNPKEAIYDN